MNEDDELFPLWLIAFIFLCLVIVGLLVYWGLQGPSERDECRDAGGVYVKMEDGHFVCAGGER